MLKNLSIDEVSISHQHTFNLNFHPGTTPNGASPQIISEFAPITPYKAMQVKSKRVSELVNLCSDDRTSQERDEQNNDIAAQRVVSNEIQNNKQLVETVSDASVSAVSTQIKENENPEKGIVDLNKTPWQKPKRKKHRPKVAKEGKPWTPKHSKDNPTDKQRYVHKALNYSPTSAPVEAAGESINLKTPDPSMKSCRKSLKFDVGLTEDENSACKSTFDSVSVSQARDFCQSKSNGQLYEVTEVMTPKPAGSKQNPTDKRKYVRRKEIGEKSTPQEAAAATIDTEMLEHTKEFCTTFDFGMQEQPRDENSTCKSTFGLIPESQAKELFMSTVQLGKGDAVTTPKPATPLPNHSKEHQIGKRKYVRNQGLNKDSTSTPAEVAGVSNDLEKSEPAKKSCRRTLNFDIEGLPRNENSTNQSSLDLNSGKYSFRRVIQSRSIVQLGEGIEVIVENTQVGSAYDLTRSVNRLIKDDMSSPEGQKQTVDSRNENITEGTGQETADNRERNTKQVILQIDNQSSPDSPRSPNDSKCGTCAISIDQRQAWEPKRENSNANKQADTGSSNMNSVHYLTLQAYQMPEPHFPNYRKRTEKGQSSTTSSTSSCMTAAKNISPETCSEGDVRADSTTSDQEKQKTLEDTLASSPVKRLKRKRSRCSTRVRDLASLTRIVECTMQQTYPGSRGPLDSDKQHVGNSQRPQTCIEALVAEMHKTLARKKRTKRNTLVSSIYSNSNEAQKHPKIILNNHHRFTSNLLGT